MEIKNKSIDLFGTTYRIKIVDSISLEEGDYLYGFTDPINKEIKVAKTIAGKKISNNEMEITLIHELMHAILLTGQYNDYSDNESLVEWLARCMYQCIKKGLFK